MTLLLSEYSAGYGLTERGPLLPFFFDCRAQMLYQILDAPMPLSPIPVFVVLCSAPPHSSLHCFCFCSALLCTGSFFSPCFSARRTLLWSTSFILNTFHALIRLQAYKDKVGPEDISTCLPYERPMALIHALFMGNGWRAFKDNCMEILYYECLTSLINLNH